MLSLTHRQAELIASTLRALDTEELSVPVDGFQVQIRLVDVHHGETIGHFTEEEGTWLFDFVDTRLRNLMQGPDPFV